MNLKEQIIKANESYRVGNPVMSDAEYDVLLDKLEDSMGFIEFEVFKQTLTESKGTIKLDYVLGSLSKLKYEESDNFYKWVKKHNLTKLFISLKVDGCSFMASYREGKLVMCSSRGDGDSGTDWTDKAKYILPTVISYKTDLDIRGEFTLTDNSHQLLGYKNRRNGTVGIMNKDQIIGTEICHVKAIAYEVLSGSMEIEEQFSFLNEFGFTTPPTHVFSTATDTHNTLKSFYEDMKAFVNYDIDGLVVSSPTYKRENVFLPEAKIAFKINSEGVKTTVKGIEWNISKGGLLKPVVLVEPTEIDGTTIQRATGNNYNYLIENGIGTGAEVLILKSGEVIPKIIKVTKKSTLVSVDMPTYCPSCNNTLVVKGVDLACGNKDCGTVKVKSLASFLIKSGVEGVTETSLTNWGITGYRSMLSFKGSDGKAQASFISELSKKVFSKPKEELFANMTFDGAGSTNINKIINHFGNGDLESATREIFINKTITDFPEGIGQKVMDKIASDWKTNLYLLNFIMKDTRYKPVHKVVQNYTTSCTLSNKSFCITGTLSKGRKEFETMITDNGGTLSSISKKLNYLLVGADAGGKLDKAKSLGVTILTEDEFLKMI